MVVDAIFGFSFDASEGIRAPFGDIIKVINTQRHTHTHTHTHTYTHTHTHIHTHTHTHTNLF
jgi:hypothetical protein